MTGVIMTRRVRAIHVWTKGGSRGSVIKSVRHMVVVWGHPHTHFLNSVLNAFWSQTVSSASITSIHSLTKGMDLLRKSMIPEWKGGGKG